jgi:di/tripeptidase
MMMPPNEELRAALMEARGIIRDYYAELGDWEQAAMRLKRAYEAWAPDTPEPLREAIEALLQLLPDEDW